MENEITPPEQANKIGKIQVTKVWLTPQLEKELYDFNESFQFFSSVSLVKASDGSHTFIMKTPVYQTANRALLHWFIAFAEKQLRENQLNNK